MIKILFKRYFNTKKTLKSFSISYKIVFISAIYSIFLVLYLIGIPLMALINITFFSSMKFVLIAICVLLLFLGIYLLYYFYFQFLMKKEDRVSLIDYKLLMQMETAYTMLLLALGATLSLTILL